MVGETNHIVVPEGMSQREIAARAGVSVATASRAINGSPLVSQVTTRRVKEAIRLLAVEGYGATLGVKGRRIALTNSHLVQTPVTPHTMLQEILGGVESTALGLGCSVYTLHQSGFLLGNQRDEILNGIDGLLLVGGVVSPEVIEAVSNRNIPTVLVGGHVPDSSIPSVAGDVGRGTYLMVRHFAELGHKRIAFVNGPSETYTSVERRSGYLSGMFDSGLPVDADLIRWEDGIDGFQAGAGERCTKQLLGLESRPTAILYAADTSALGGLRAIREADLSVPGDISIAGFDDTQLASASTPQLSSVSVDRVEWGAMAFYRLLRLLDGERSFAGDRLLLPVTIKVRESSAKPGEEHYG